MTDLRHSTEWKQEDQSYAQEIHESIIDSGKECKSSLDDINRLKKNENNKGNGMEAHKEIYTWMTDKVNNPSTITIALATTNHYELDSNLPTYALPSEEGKLLCEKLSKS